jgi:hypothetical protein
MSMIELNAIYQPSDEIVAREIEGELIIVPLTSGYSDMEDELYSFNETGRAIWKLLDGKRDLAAVIAALEKDFDAPAELIKEDVAGLVNELVSRKILIEVGK